jgi:hypothetical protein
MSEAVEFDLQGAYRRAVALTKPGKRDPHGEAEGVVTKPSQLDEHYHASTVIMCKDIADILVKRYPGWSWAVQPQDFGQVVNIFNLHLHSEFAYTIRYDDIMNDPRRRQAIKGGHEILRRFGVSDRMIPYKLAELPRDARGNCIPDISDMADRKMKQEAEIARGLATGRMEIVRDSEGNQYLKVNW